MRKVYKLENLDCANCAAKMDEANMDAIVEQAVQVCKKIEPDMTILR